VWLQEMEQEGKRKHSLSWPALSLYHSRAT
jgi:hypothetical protein